MNDYSFKDDYKSIHFVINNLAKNPNLNDYEKGFIIDMKSYVIDKNGFMSEKQKQFLSNLWEKY